MTWNLIHLRTLKRTDHEYGQLDMYMQTVSSSVTSILGGTSVAS